MRVLSFALVGAVALSALAACGDDESGPVLVSVSGDAIPFENPPYGRVQGAVITVVEHPEMTYTTGADGHFVFEGLEAGSRVTLELSHPNYVPIQTATITLTDEGAERVTFQAVLPGMYDILAQLIDIVPDPERCQMVTTLTRYGKSMYDEGAHGEAGATVTIEPPLPADSGPIYFNAQVLPDRALTESSEDGGVLFVNVPPGEYVWTAHKEGVAFAQVRMTCRAGYLVNGSPPWGLQALTPPGD